MKLPIWSHHVTTSYVQSVIGPDDAGQPFSEIWEKCLDGPIWMSNYDRHARAISSLTTVRARRSEHRNAGRIWRPWAVPRGTHPEAEGRMFADVALAGLQPNEPPIMILDLEPYYHGGSSPQFWRSDLGADGDTARALLDAYRSRAGNDAEIWLCVDARGSHTAAVSFPAWWSHAAVTQVHPMTYWTDFRRPWRESVDAANAHLAGLGVPAPAISHVFPANAAPADLRGALEYSATRGNLPASLWQRLNLSLAARNEIAGMADPWELARPGRAEAYRAGYGQALEDLAGFIEQSAPGTVPVPPEYR